MHLHSELPIFVHPSQMVCISKKVNKKVNNKGNKSTQVATNNKNLNTSNFYLKSILLPLFANHAQVYPLLSYFLKTSIKIRNFSSWENPWNAANSNCERSEMYYLSMPCLCSSAKWCKNLFWALPLLAWQLTTCKT